MENVSDTGNVVTVDGNYKICIEDFSEVQDHIDSITKILVALV